MITERTIEAEATESSASIVLSPKNDGLLCFGVDHQLLNEITTRILYHLLRMDECIERFKEATEFSTLNAKLWYLHI